MANKRWLGRASAVAQVDTVTVADTWATADFVALTINAKDLVITIGEASPTPTTVALAIKEAWQNDTFTDALNSKIPEDGGQDFVEHAEITATVSGAVVTLTHDTPGTPFTLTAVATTGGDGDVTVATGTTATGPNFYDNADNWDPTNVPIAADDVFIDNSAVSILFGLDQGGIALTSFTVARNYTGDIGLPKQNAAGYAEYRDDYLVIRSPIINIGRGEGSGSGRIKIDSGTQKTGTHTTPGGNNDAVLTDSAASFNVNALVGWTISNTTDSSSSTVTANTATTVTGVLAGGTDNDWDLGDAYTIDPPAAAVVTVENTGSSAEFGIEAFLWKGTETSNTLDVLDGSVGVAPFGGEIATLATLRETAGTVRCGAGTTLAIVSNQSGNLAVHSNIATSLTNASGTVLVGGSATVAILNANGGTVDHQSSGTITTANIGGPSGATVDFSGRNVGRTIENCNLDSGGQIIDPLRTVIYTNGIVLGANAETVEVR